MGVLVFGVMHTLAQATPPSEALADVQAQIDRLQQDIFQSEKYRDAASQKLVASAHAVSAARRKLREIAHRKELVQREILRLKTAQQNLKNDLKALGQQLGDAILRTYEEGGQAGARRLLSGEDPNVISRDTYYLEQIAKERQATIDEARLAVQNLKQMEAQTAQQREQIVGLELQRKKELARIEQERKNQQAILAKITQKLKAQHGEMASLQQDQERLQKLLEGLARIAKDQENAQHEKVPEQVVPATQSESTPSSSIVEEHMPTVVPSPSQVSAPVPSFSNFAKLKGALPWPVKGTLFTHFGSARAEGGANWRGVFIKAPEGSQVHAVAAGVVVFSDWLRGFGNLLIIDHDNGYMTVYGNNASLLKSAGEPTEPGEVVATTGSSDGSNQTGLYFEVRYRGQPVDPVKWLIAK